MSTTAAAEPLGAKCLPLSRMPPDGEVVEELGDQETFLPHHAPRVGGPGGGMLVLREQDPVLEKACRPGLETES